MRNLIEYLVFNGLLRCLHCITEHRWWSTSIVTNPPIVELYWVKAIAFKAIACPTQIVKLS